MEYYGVHIQHLQQALAFDKYIDNKAQACCRFEVRSTLYGFWILLVDLAYGALGQGHAQRRTLGLCSTEDKYYKSSWTVLRTPYSIHIQGPHDVCRYKCTCKIK
jgi:hypothetical protein